MRRCLISNICSQLHSLFNILPRFRYPFLRENIIPNGIYILFEKGEYAHGGDRIVRVGTHRGDNRLYDRLREHFIKENKDRSILRKNIGRALLNKRCDPFLEQWDWKLNSKKARKEYLPRLNKIKLQEIEREVSQYIRTKFSFVIFPVENQDDRRKWEQKVISTISICEECCPSAKWLGLYSPVTKIRESGLWLVQGLYKKGLTIQEFEELKMKIDDFVKRC